MLAEQMPPKIKRSHLKTFPDGREVLDISTAEGSREYRGRTLEMRDRQRELCPICTLWMAVDDTTFEHEDLRGKFHDDRILKPVDICDDEGNVIEVVMVPYNFAVHKLCNVAKGSKRTLKHPEAA